MVRQREYARHTYEYRGSSMSCKYSLALSALLLATVPLHAQEDDSLNDKIEQAIKAAVNKVAPSVVQIITQGGAEQVFTNSSGQIVGRKAMGPTTGVILSDDGYVISSSFNFVNEPTGILVRCLAAPILSSPRKWRWTRHACSRC